MAITTNTPGLDRFARSLTLYTPRAQEPTPEPAPELEGGGEFIIPEDLSALTDEELRDLHGQAVAHFDDVYSDGQGLSDADLDALAALTEGIETLTGEMDTRAEAARDREAAAAALAARAHPTSGSEPAPEADSADSDAEGDDTGTDQGETGDAPEAPAAPAAPVGSDVTVPVAVAASGSREVRVNMGALRSRSTAAALPRPAHEARTLQDVMLASGEGSGYAAGTGIGWEDAGRIVDRRMAGFNEGQYAQANRAGQHIREQHGVATIRKPIDPSLMITSADPAHVEEVLRRARDESRLPGGSLVASGGWCAPSITLYDLYEVESRDGLVSLPTVGITRGGINVTPGPNFATIYGAVGFGPYTEADDVAGNYAGVPGAHTTGSKPCYKIPCPSFTEYRLSTTGLCLTAGLLQQRGYPEVISRTVRGALVAHDHQVSAILLAALCAGSTPVTMTTGVVGTLSPLLTSIELQVEHYRYTERYSRGTTLEAIFPYWVHGAIRSDLALRAGTLEVDVTDAQIDTWFRSRGIAPQFVYDWQPITGASGDFKQWPATCQFLLYASGTWVEGTSDVITVDTLYDSVLLGTNDYIALFTEEAYLLALLGHDSRCITVPICPSGSTGGSVVIACDGTPAVTNDMTDPVAGTVAGSAIGATGFTLTVSGASDAGVGLDAEPYRFSTNGGLTWTEWQTSNVKVVTGLTTGTLYHCRHEVRDADGNTKVGAIVDVTTS